MTQPIIMPALSPTMTKGALAKWLVAVGDKVAVGDIIAEVETDKVTIELEANQTGFVAELKCAEGDADIPVDAVIAVLSDTEVAAEPAAEPQAEPVAEKPIAVAATSAPEPILIEQTPSQVSQDIDISPLARRMANIGQVDLSKVQGTGAKGRIVKRDIEKAMGMAEKAKATQSYAPAAAKIEINPDTLPDFDEIKLTGMRSVIAERLTESSRDIPHFYMTVDCRLDALLDTRKMLNEQLSDGKISVNDMLVKAVAVAFSMVPKANVLWAGDRLLQFKQSDIAIAVAIEDGLITPVLRNATNLGLQGIARQTKQLVEKARSGKLTPEDYQGGTFTISNLGMYGIKEFTSIINPPHNGILSVGAGEKRPVVDENGELAVATVMSLTLAMDHRAVDGATGAQLLKALKEIIEQPFKLML